MPLSLEDQSRLPEMIDHEDILLKQQRDDLKDFRQYLVDTGMLKCLVKMSAHTVKNEMRINNPRLVVDFLTKYSDAGDENKAEIDSLQKENVTMRDYQQELLKQAGEATEAIAAKRREVLAKRLWAGLTASEFWDGRPGAPSAEDFRTSGLTASRLYERLCGNQMDSGTGRVLVDLIKPPGIVAAGPDALLRAETMKELVPQMDDDLFKWTWEVLITRLKETNSPPFEGKLVATMRSSDYYPRDMQSAAEDVELEPDLLMFLEATTNFLKV